LITDNKIQDSPGLKYKCDHWIITKTSQNYTLLNVVFKCLSLDVYVLTQP